MLLGAEANVINEPVTWVDWAVAAGIFLGGLVGGRILHKLLVRAVRRGDAEGGSAEAIGRVAAFVVASVAFIYALIALGVRLGPFLGAIGIGGVAVAFAAQAILANFLASVILQMRRPFRRGEQVSTNGVDGTVEDVNFRTVVLRTYDGERVLVPSSKVLNEPIVNHTRLGRRRTSLAVSVAYDTDLDKAVRVLTEAVRGVPEVFVDPEPDVHVEQFADSGVELLVRFWHAPDIASLYRARTAVAIAVKQALDDAGIVIPFPQLVIRTP